MLTSEEYDELERVVFGVAAGSKGEPMPVDQRVTRTTKEDGADVTRVQSARVREPDLKLALELLGGRIGGPQDYC